MRGRALALGLAVPTLLCGAVLCVPAVAAADPGCGLGPIRDRIDDVASSMTVDRVAKSTIFDQRGEPVTQVDYGLSGELEGCVVLDGPIPDLSKPDRFSWMYDDDGLSLQQEHLVVDGRARVGPALLPLEPGDGNTSPPIYATSRFESSQGAGIDLLYPSKAERWNGKMVVFAPGASVYLGIGSLAPRSRGDKYPQLLGRNNFAAVALDEGYAVMWPRRDQGFPGTSVSSATLPDGSTIAVSHHNSVSQMVSLIEFAQRRLAIALGTAPTKTYFYGHSSGPMIGRLIQYTRGANVAHDGTPIVDGFLFHEVGAGFPLPILFDGNEDTLFRTAAERRAFVPQMDITGQLYVPWKYLELRRLNLATLQAKGLGNKARHYEIRELTHRDRGQAARSGEPDPNVLDMGGVIRSLLDRLDLWVTHGVTPPDSRQDDVSGSAPAVALPEVACPLGVRYAPGGDAITTFVPFDGAGLEVFDEVAEMRGGPGAGLVDMNANGVRDERETVTEAWRRLGLLRPNQKFKVGEFRNCLVAAAVGLEHDGLLSEGAANYYKRNAEAMLVNSGAAY